MRNRSFKYFSFRENTVPVIALTFFFSAEVAKGNCPTFDGSKYAQRIGNVCSEAADPQSCNSLRDKLASVSQRIQPASNEACKPLPTAKNVDANKGAFVELKQKLQTRQTELEQLLKRIRAEKQALKEAARQNARAAKNAANSEPSSPVKNLAQKGEADPEVQATTVTTQEAQSVLQNAKTSPPSAVTPARAGGGRPAVKAASNLVAVGASHDYIRELKTAESQLSASLNQIKSQITAADKSIQRADTASEKKESGSGDESGNGSNENSGQESKTAEDSKGGFDPSALAAAAPALAGLAQQKQASNSSDSGMSQNPYAPDLSTPPVTTKDSGPSTSNTSSSKSSEKKISTGSNNPLFAAGKPEDSADSSSPPSSPSLFDDYVAETGVSPEENASFQSGKSKSGASTTPSGSSGGGGSTGSSSEGFEPRELASLNDLQTPQDESLQSFGGGLASFDGGSSSSSSESPTDDGMGGIISDMEAAADPELGAMEEGGEIAAADPSLQGEDSEGLFPRVKAAYMRSVRKGLVLSSVQEKIQ